MLRQEDKKDWTWRHNEERAMPRLSQRTRSPASAMTRLKRAASVVVRNRSGVYVLPSSSPERDMGEASMSPVGTVAGKGKVHQSPSLLEDDDEVCSDLTHSKT